MKSQSLTWKCKSDYKKSLNIYLPSDFVTQRFCGDNGDFFAYPLVGVEVQCQSSVVFFDDDPGGLLDGLRPYTTLNDNNRHDKKGRNGFRIIDTIFKSLDFPNKKIPYGSK